MKKSKFGDEWPANIQFSNNYEWDERVPTQVKDQYYPTLKVRERAPYLSPNVYFRRISDPNHPAHGQFGLFCAIKHGKPGQWLLDYVGYVTRGEDEDKSSDYVSDFGEKNELACE